MKKIDFIGIGVQKSATSWIFQCLLEHPEVQVGKGKELNFFNDKYSFGYHWYQNKFQFNNKKTGEFSTQYFWNRNVPERIHRYNPNVKLLLCLRNPVDRAFSQHQHEVRRGRLPEEYYDFDKALISNPSYIEQGYYAQHLEHFFKYFKKNQILIIFHEDIIKNPHQVLSELYNFLNIEDTFRPQAQNKKINQARTYRSRSIDKFYRQTKRLIHQYTNKNIVNWIKSFGIHEWVESYNSIEQDPKIISPLSDNTCARLEKIFSNDIKRLEDLVDRDLSQWFKHN